MTGKLKTKGNMMFATKLVAVLKVRPITVFVASLPSTEARVIGHKGSGQALGCMSIPPARGLYMDCWNISHAFH